MATSLKHIHIGREYTGARLNGPRFTDTANKPFTPAHGLYHGSILRYRDLVAGKQGVPGDLVAVYRIARRISDSEVWLGNYYPVTGGAPVCVDSVLKDDLAADDTAVLQEEDQFGNGVDANGLIAIDDEIIRYGTRSGTQLIACTRGACGTTAATHRKGAKILYLTDFPAETGVTYTLGPCQVSGETVESEVMAVCEWNPANSTPTPTNMIVPELVAVDSLAWKALTVRNQRGVILDMVLDRWSAPVGSAEQTAVGIEVGSPSPLPLNALPANEWLKARWRWKADAGQDSEGVPEAGMGLVKPAPQPCEICADEVPETGTVTIAGFTGVCAVLNGQWAVAQFHADTGLSCQWMYEDDDVFILLCTYERGAWAVTCTAKVTGTSVTFFDPATASLPFDCCAQASVPLLNAEEVCNGGGADATCVVVMDCASASPSPSPTITPTATPSPCATPPFTPPPSPTPPVSTHTGTPTNPGTVDTPPCSQQGSGCCVGFDRVTWYSGTGFWSMQQALAYGKANPIISMPCNTYTPGHQGKCANATGACVNKFEGVHWDNKGKYWVVRYLPICDNCHFPTPTPTPSTHTPPASTHTPPPSTSTPPPSTVTPPPSTSTPTPTTSTPPPSTSTPTPFSPDPGLYYCLRQDNYGSGTCSYCPNSIEITALSVGTLSGNDCCGDTCGNYTDIRHVGDCHWTAYHPLSYNCGNGSGYTPFVNINMDYDYIYVEVVSVDVGGSIYYQGQVARSCSGTVNVTCNKISGDCSESSVIVGITFADKSNPCDGAIQYTFYDCYLGSNLPALDTCVNEYGSYVIYTLDNETGHADYFDCFDVCPQA